MVAKGYQRRPSSDEPWRYGCPDCGSVNIEQLIGGTRPRGKTYPMNGRGTAAIQRDREKRVLCRSCGERKAAMVDRKTGNQVSSV